MITGGADSPVKRGGVLLVMLNGSCEVTTNIDRATGISFKRKYKRVRVVNYSSYFFFLKKKVEIHHRHEFKRYEELSIN